MNIDNYSNIYFEAKSPQIRFADYVARKVNSYQKISSSRAARYKHIDKFPLLKQRLGKKTTYKMRSLKDKKYDYASSFVEKIGAFIEPIKKFKIGNCSECAQIAAIIAKINGIKDCHIIHLHNNIKRELFHAALFVNDKKPYIIDPWLGAVDYFHNMMIKYESFFGLSPKSDMSICTTIDDEYTNFLKGDFTKSQKKKILKVYPELKINH